ncbi:GNAT family N-acetyltransferase [Brevibacterium luteolum]|uniref:GNAT family N-acetyltransferase n=1 Tax=Brevibacterium luteolum TaxID=199591 RepID=UPI00223BA6AE|nr:GNAT family N-acetyltransferase [Brevibacterium luteolum]MCT1872761.1 GNAT family N-acetyltransferase [Brevibacterium luteolum]MCT1890275.1 GNAT family N-acetyltransferase [Brevibacterium luteolum]MCT1891911.1 GNAT family N-acetyltransferase [Brevibacterium luteolum]MCT1923452.1 GNAT family N-acetyltransferase [Brevibacterium luteolum]
MHITPLPADRMPEEARELLLPFLLQCINWSPGAPERDASVIEADDQLSAYIDGWGRDGDIAVIAWDEENQPVGAAWCRLLSDPPGFGWVADDIPEVSIAVAPDFQAKGAGRQLLHTLCRLAAVSGYSAVSLSVSDGNMSKHLYTQLGFSDIGRSGDGDVMLKQL